MDNNPLDSEIWQEMSVKPLNILITGKAGTGKSTLVSNLIGKNISKEGETLRPETSKVSYFQRLVNGVPMRVFDSPELQDGTNKENECVHEKCKDVDLILYTIKMTDERMHDDDVQAMRELTVAFGEKFWSKAVIVLTFANRVQVPTEPGTPDYEEEFQKKLQLWNDTLRYVLNTTLGVSNDIVIEVPIVPAGYYQVQHLPGHRSWFSEFWRTALYRMKEISEESFMLEYSKDRWQKLYKSTPDDLKETTDKQHIYESKGWWS
jgi:signal recognition particle receptor subunit beta